MVSTSSNVSFSRTHVPYARVFSDLSDHELTGVFVLYHAKRVNDVEDIVPVYLGYGNIMTELRLLETKLKFLMYEPLYYDYIADPADPYQVLEKLRQQYKPLLAA